MLFPAGYKAEKTVRLEFLLPSWSLNACLISKKWSQGMERNKLVPFDIIWTQVLNHTWSHPSFLGLEFPDPLHFLFSYRHTSVYCALLHCASQRLRFFTDWKQDPPPAQGLQLWLRDLLYCSGLEPNPQHLWSMPVLKVRFLSPAVERMLNDILSHTEKSLGLSLIVFGNGDHSTS